MTGLEIQRVLALRGPNLWARFPVLEVWVDLGPLKDSSSDALPGFNDRLKSLLPSLIEHRCSVGERGGFFQRLERGTYLAHILEHVVLELQTLAGTEVGYGKTRMTNTDGVYKMAIEYEDEEVARAAVELGQNVCLAAIHGTPIDLEAGLIELRSLLERNRPAAGVPELLTAAKAAGVPARVLDASGLVQLGWGANQRRVLNGQTDRASGVGASIAADRSLTRTIIRAAGVPVASGTVVKSADAAAEAAEGYYPVVLRPRYVTAGTVATAPLTNEAELRAAFQVAYESWTPIVDSAAGDEYRLLVIGGKLISAIDASGQDVTGCVHPAIAERIADAALALKLDVAAVEVVTSDVSKPLEEVGGVVVGVDAKPTLSAFPGPVATAIVESLYTEPRKSRIPVVAVTGTNGKTTTTKLAAHLLGQIHAPVGMTFTEGIRIGDRRIETGDCSGPKSAKMVLQHPEARAAVLETARGGILREGLGFDRCDVAIVTNIGAGDHLGTSDIETAEDLAGVKETIVWSVAPWGACVLNAADPLVVNMKRLCDGATIFFARDGANPVVTEHRAAGGKAVFSRDHKVILAEGNREEVLIDLARVPLTHGGRVGFQVENVLAAVAAAWFLEVPHDAIRNGLETFHSDFGRSPGRFNLVNFRGATAIADYGHNTSALVKLFETLNQLPHKFRTIVYSAAGDRRDSDIIEQGELLGNFFDRVVLYEDQYLRGREPGEISRLFKEGLSRGNRTLEVWEVPSGMGSIEAALNAAAPGELVVLQLDMIDTGVALIKKMIAAGGRELTWEEAVAAGKHLGGHTVEAPAVETREDRLGKTVFARRDIARGELIARGWGPTQRERIMHTMQVAPDLHMDPPAPIRFLNHSCDPNCGVLIRNGVPGLELHALRDIPAGEELTLDYETFEIEFQSLTGPCLCLSPHCRGKLVGYRGLSAKRRAYYGKYIAEYLRTADVPAVAPTAVVSGS